MNSSLVLVEGTLDKSVNGEMAPRRPVRVSIAVSENLRTFSMSASVDEHAFFSVQDMLAVIKTGVTNVAVDGVRVSRLNGTRVGGGAYSNVRISWWAGTRTHITLDIDSAAMATAVHDSRDNVFAQIGANKLATKVDFKAPVSGGQGLL